MKRTLIALVASLALVPLAYAQGKPAQDLVRPFDYDAKQPLDIQEKTTHERDAIKVIDLTYASPWRGFWNRN